MLALTPACQPAPVLLDLMSELLLLLFAGPPTRNSALQALSRPSGRLLGLGTSTSQGLVVGARAGADATPMSHWEGCQPSIAAMVHLLLV